MSREKFVEAQLTDQELETLADFVSKKTRGGGIFNAGSVAAEANVRGIIPGKLITFNHVNSIHADAKPAGVKMIKRTKEEIEAIENFIAKHSELGATEISKKINEEKIATSGDVYPGYVTYLKAKAKPKVKKAKGKTSEAAENSGEEYTFAGLERKIEEVKEYARNLQNQQAEKAKALFLA